jgi:putative oxidoreductase
MREAFLLGRLLAGGYYLWSGFQHFANLKPMTRFVAARDVPAPELAVMVAGLLLLVAGVTFVLGVYPRVGVMALVLFLVPVTLIMHPFWDVRGAERVAALGLFTRNLALLGSALMLLAIPEPWPYAVNTRASVRRPLTT